MRLHRTHVVAIIIALALLLLFALRTEHASASSTSITGYAWSDTVGWISMSGTG